MFRPIDEKSLIGYIKATPSFSSEIGDSYNDITIKEVGDGHLNFVDDSFVIKQEIGEVIISAVRQFHW
ncbi:hypothetical protein HRI_002496400 [Hibiscus trionum]|uniref:Uncharacterized protein n=1 Tax=Hibiscus trionum TaxID=183268 RepID=A0A9W7I495_HIBTR|nr:hypothetical protein HRI_002496400 [Hibiscus trionum]